MSVPRPVSVESLSPSWSWSVFKPNAGLDKISAEKLKEEISCLGVKVEAYQVDIKNFESVRLATTESWYRDVIEFMIDDEKRHHRILTALSKAFSTGEDRIEKYYRLADTLTDQAVRNSRVRGPP